MDFPLKTANQFHLLDQKKQKLGEEKFNLKICIQKHLIPHSLNVDSSSQHLPYLTDSANEISTHQVNRMFSFLLKLNGKIEELNEQYLLELHHHLTLNSPVGYRDKNTQPAISNHIPLAPANIASAIERFFEWVRSPSFSEMHPIQQMTLSQIRLWEIYPFSHYCQVTISIFSSYFLTAQLFLPPLYPINQLPDFHNALKKAFLFSTQPLIDLNVEACHRSYDFVLEKENS